MCKKTIHAEHAEKGVFFEYFEFINVARTRIHAYKEKFQKYVEACNIPKKEVYDTFVSENEGVVDRLYEAQKIKIEEQFVYLTKLIEEMKVLEIDFLTKYKDFFKLLYGKVNDNYKGLLLEIVSGNKN